MCIVIILAELQTSLLFPGVVGVSLVTLGAWCLSCRSRSRDARREYMFAPLPDDDKRPLCENGAYGMKTIKTLTLFTML